MLRPCWGRIVHHRMPFYHMQHRTSRGSRDFLCALLHTKRYSSSVHCQAADLNEDSGMLSSAAASIQLLPSLLGFPIGLRASGELLLPPSQSLHQQQREPREEPRQQQRSYKGAMLDGLQASRKLHRNQPPQEAVPWQEQQPSVVPPGVQLSFLRC